MSSKFTPELPDLFSSGWGPTDDSTPSFSGLPFTPFSKRDSINYVANWDDSASSRPRRQQRSRTKFGDDSVHLGALNEEDDYDQDFEGGITVKKKSYEVIAKYRRDRTGQQNKLTYSQKRVAIAEQQRLQNAPVSRKGTRRQVQNKRRRKKYIENPRPVKPSIAKNENWVDLHDIWFRESFERNNIKSYTFRIDGEEIHNMVYQPRRKQLTSAGILHGVLTRFDTRSGNSYRAEPLNYEKYSDFKYLNFNFKSAIQDPYILELANKPTGANIYTTDNVMSAIMCCNRSKYSFDIVINKIGDKIFLDERNKVLSSYSVDETSQNRPTKKNTSKINKYESLAQEATYINHVFKEQMVFHQNLEHRQKMKRLHPFQNEIGGIQQQSGKGKKGKKKQQQQRKPTNQEPAAQAFTYNLYDVTDNIQVIVRCAIDGYVVDPRNPRSKQKDWCQIFALNQYDSNRSKTQNWLKYLDTRDSTILSQEITNNNFKCARWGIKAHLSGSKYLKIGYVTRANVHSTEKHLICGVKTYETDDFIRNRLRMRSLNDPWTIFAKFMKSIFELKDDGRYIAIRDPLKQVIRLYKTRDDDFNKDDNMPTFQNLRKWVKVPKNKRNSQRDVDDNKAATAAVNDL